MNCKEREVTPKKSVCKDTDAWRNNCRKSAQTPKCRHMRTEHGDMYFYGEVENVIVGKIDTLIINNN